MKCKYCGKLIDQKITGRSRLYCSEECRKKYRADLYLKTKKKEDEELTKEYNKNPDKFMKKILDNITVLKEERESNHKRLNKRIKEKYRLGKEKMEIIKKKKKWIISQLSLEALHKWDRPFNEVGFLKDWHRHMFAIKVFVEVTHNDRDIEFINLGHEIKEYLHDTLDRKSYGETTYYTVGSCEMLAETIYNYIVNKHERNCKVEVFEDGINGPGGALIE